MFTNPKISRRTLLKATTALSAIAAAEFALPRWMPRLAFAQPYNNPRGDVMIVVFLRGGADALNMIVPHGDETYYAARPTLAIARPDSSTTGKAIDLDGFFGLHPALTPLLPIFQGGQLAAIHATGAPHNSRSHFEAMSMMERGIDGSYDAASGWVGRHLATLDTGNTSPIRGIGWGTATPTSMIGAPSAVAMKSIVDYHLDGDMKLAAQMMQALYTLESEPLAHSATSTQAAIDLVASIGYADYVPRNGSTYPESDFSLALRQTAAIIRADAGLEVACIDLGGWDTHANQGTIEGAHAVLMRELAEGLAAFHQDLGAEMSGVTLLVMSEFGRRVEENANSGTDHGSGGAMMLMSGNLNTTPVVARWPGLTPDVLANGEDLSITTDYRDVLAEVLSVRLNNPATGDVFPDHTPASLGLFGGSLLNLTK